MLLSYNWLKELINIEDSVEKLADKITHGGLEVEEVIYLDEELSGLVVGHVVEKEKHPDAEKLNVCKVDVGGEELLQIVCGAANVDKGQHVIVATVGAKLPGIKIKRAKLRGVESQGMICSLKELGIGQSLIPKNYQEGIYVFAEEVAVGSNVVEVLGLNDAVIDIAITPNRADALSMRGLVYEVAAIYGKEANLKETVKEISYPETALKVAVESENCVNYYGQVVNNIKVEDSPLWLQQRLINSGVRPINNIVDITNYVLLEYGQPMHAFDKDLLGANVVVRQAVEGETIVTLDGEERKLATTDLVITDGTKPVALAGVMGGKDTEVSETTTSIVLESAYFHPVSVRRTSAAHGLRSDSSARFEKGIDANLQQIALERALELILELCPEAQAEKVVGVGTQKEPATVVVTTTYLNNFLGLKLTTEEIKNILSALAFDVKVDGEELTVVVPTRRPDITIKQDIAEEVVRMFGYDNVPATLPKFSKATKGGLTYKQKMVRKLRRSYLNNGFFDNINYSLVSEEEAGQFVFEEQPKVKLLMPMSENHSTLRQSLVPGLLTATAYNNARQQKNLKLVELGRVFFGSGSAEIQPTEQLYLAGLLTGQKNLTKWLKEESSVDFYDAKGYLELAFEELGILADISYKKVVLENMHPGRTAQVFYKNESIGFVGEVHPVHSANFDLAATYVFEINLDKVLTEDKVKPTYEEISKYPKVTRDIAMLIAENDSYANIYSVIKNLNIKLVNNVELFDLYDGIGLPEGTKSIALTVTYVDKEKTLTDEEINKAHNKVLDALVAYGVTIR